MGLQERGGSVMGETCMAVMSRGSSLLHKSKWTKRGFKLHNAVRVEGRGTKLLQDFKTGPGAGPESAHFLCLR